MILRRCFVAFLACGFLILPYFSCSARSDDASTPSNTTIDTVDHAVDDYVSADFGFIGIDFSKTDMLAQAMEGYSSESYAAENAAEEDEFGEDVGDDETQYEDVESDDGDDEDVESDEGDEEYYDDEGSDDDVGTGEDEEYGEDEGFDDYEAEEESAITF